MKIYRLDKGIILIGKAWEIRAKLKEYGGMYTSVNEWIRDEKMLQHSATCQKNR